MREDLGAAALCNRQPNASSGVFENPGTFHGLSALSAYSEAQAVEPNNEIPNIALGYAYAGKRMYREAASYYLRAVNEPGGEKEYSQALVYLAATYAKMPEKRDEARAMLARIEGIGGCKSPALLAAVHSALGDSDRAARAGVYSTLRSAPLHRRRLRIRRSPRRRPV